MDSIRIRGGKSLKGTIRVSGAKNAALPILCATLLSDGDSLLRNVPALRDIETTAALLRFLAAGSRHPTDRHRGRRLGATRGAVRAREADARQRDGARAALGATWPRQGLAPRRLPDRLAPVDQHLKALERLGATIQLERGYIIATCPRLRGNEVVFDMPTVTGTENIMMACALAKGKSRLVNAAKEPEIEELGRVLNKMARPSPAPAPT